MDLNAILWLGTFRLLHSDIPLPPFLNWSKHCLFFIIFCLFNTVDSTYKLCRQLDSNRRCLVSKVTVLSTAPQPLSLFLPFPITRITINGNGGIKKLYRMLENYGVYFQTVMSYSTMKMSLIWLTKYLFEYNLNTLALK